ncbi:hypothetical protein DFQ27_003749 [Actinomortierella ambigua]|uniref:Uncharacterized protein n=1 Tax=Actinomortierella ambigua TaxID=1343610 RepID=A0A9P6U5F9_9FUNG|nr:hypothetical protein DFQ27_003749 [Actinomortierella ambigua]
MITFSASTPHSIVGSSSSSSSSASSSSSSSPSSSSFVDFHTTVMPLKALASTDSIASKVACSVVDGCLMKPEQSNSHQVPPPTSDSIHTPVSEMDTQPTALLPSLPIPSSHLHHHLLAHQLSTTSLDDDDGSSGPMDSDNTAVEEAREGAYDPATGTTTTTTTTATSASITATRGSSSSLDGDSDVGSDKNDDSVICGPFYSRLRYVNLECCSYVSLASENKIKALMAIKQEAFRDSARSLWASTWVSTIPAASSSTGSASGVILPPVSSSEQEHEAALAAAEAASAAAAAAIKSEAKTDVEAADIQEQGSETATETLTTVTTAMETTADIPMTLATGDISSSVGVDTVSADGSVAQEALPPSSDDTDMLVDQSVASTTTPGEPLSQVA